MDLASLQVFQTVVREQSFSRAAEKLFRTQPAVSISIRKLEEWVGQPLFVRGFRRPHAHRRRRAPARIRRPHAESAGGNPQVHERTARPPARPGFSRRQRKLDPRLLPALGAIPRTSRGHPHPGAPGVLRDVPREVLSHHLDIGVISYIPEETELSAVEFYRDNLTVVVWPGPRLAKRRAVDITDLGEETFIGHIVESPHRQRVVQLFARHHVPLRMDIEMPTIESIKLFVEMKKGVAIVPRMCVGPEIEQGLLRELPMRQMRIQRRLYLVYRQDRPLTAAAQAMVDILLGKSAGKSSRAKRPFPPL